MRRRLPVLPPRLTIYSVALMGFVALSGFYLLEQIWMQVRRDFEQVAWARALTVSNDFTNAITALSIRLTTLADATGSDDDLRQREPRLAEALRLTQGQTDALLGLDHGGRVLFSSDPAITPGTNLSQWDAVRDALTGTLSVGGPVIVGHRPYLIMAEPVSPQDRSGHIGLALLNLDYFLKLITPSVADRQDLVALFKIGGSEMLRIPAPPPHTDFALAGRKLTQLLGGAVNASTVATSRIDQVSRLTAAVRAGSLGVGVAVGVPVAGLWQNFWPRAMWVCGLAGLLISLMVGFNYALAAELARRRQAEALRAAAINEVKLLAAKYQMLADSSSDVIVQIGFDGTCRYVSPAVRSLLGWHPADLVGKNTDHLIHPDDAELLHEEVQFLTTNCGPIRSHFRARHRDGRYLWVESHMQLVEAGAADSFIANLRDISDRVEAERKLTEAATEMAQLASTDSLTGLANRRRFNNELTREWRRAAREESSLSLLMLDVDHFKSFNDRYGHAGGDEVLRRVAHAIESVLRRPGDLAARWGGEEFVVLLPGTDLRGAVGVAEAVRKSVEALGIAHCGADRGYLTISIGVASAHPRHTQSPEPLLAEADANLYEAKHLGRNRVGAPPIEPMVWAGPSQS